MSQRRAASSEDELLVLSEVAHLYYVEDFTQEQIAQRIGVSRSNVSRMLKEARGQGMVEIKIHSPLRTVPGLQHELVSRLGLRECRVLAAVDHSARIFETTSTVAQVAALAARYLLENISEGDVIGLGWGRSVHRVVHSRFLREERDVTVVQAMGSIGASVAEFDGVATTARLATVLRAGAHYLHAPMLVTDQVVRDGLLRDPHIRKTLEVARRADTLVSSVGTPDPVHGQYCAGYLDDADLEYIRNQGAVGDICGAYFARDGSHVPLEMNERSISINAEEVRGIPTRIGVSSGPEKPLANIGAARSGLIDVLITDEDTAREMLNILNNETPASTSTG
ncbi:MAG: sugar-binding transcriptional regulator [Actinomycetota bacterium]|nr:sugar-binding transcriptional regulator [Actinomycetota bacterium]